MQILTNVHFCIIFNPLFKSFREYSPVSDAFCVLFGKIKAQQNVEILLPGIRRFERTQQRRFQNALKPLCFLCLDAKTHLFQVRK